MPKWIHSRAEHLLAKNPDMAKSTAFAVATQQSHALGKSPKGYGTAEGKRVAKAKFSTPGDDKKTAGMRIDLDLDFHPVRAHTHDEWLAGLFKRDGTFMVPGMLSHVGPLGKHGAAAFVDELEKIAQALPGGLAEKAHKTPEDFKPSALREGQQVEKEHTSSKPIAKEIAMDHLTEDPKYYGKPKKMEKQALGPGLLARAAASRGVDPTRLGAIGQFVRKKEQLGVGAAREHAHRIVDFLKTQPKTAASAPTRGGFMMASDIPPFQAPRLDRAIQKNSGETPVSPKMAASALGTVGVGALMGASGLGAAGLAAGLSKKPHPESEYFRMRHPAISGGLRGALVGGLLGGAGMASAIAGEHPGLLSWEARQALRPLTHGAKALGTKAKALGTVLKDEANYRLRNPKPETSAAVDALFDKFPKQAQYYKLEGDAVIETDKKGKSLGKGNLLKEKDGDFLPGTITYNPGDFKRSKYAMPTEQLSLLVADLLKESSVTSPASQLAKTQSVGAPKASAPPGPSIADQSKPSGAKFGLKGMMGFGTGIPGAHKGSIGGMGPVGIK